MNADLLTTAQPYLNSLFVAVLSFIVSLVVLLMAIAVFPYEKRWYRSKWLLTSIGCLIVSGLTTAGGVLCIQDWIEQPGRDAGNISAVREWVEPTYGVSVTDAEALSMAKAISGPRLVAETFALESADGILEVKLIEVEDGTFHLMQQSAELPLPEAKG